MFTGCKTLWQLGPALAGERRTEKAFPNVFWSFSNETKQRGCGGSSDCVNALCYFGCTLAGALCLLSKRQIRCPLSHRWVTHFVCPFDRKRLTYFFRDAFQLFFKRRLSAEIVFLWGGDGWTHSARRELHPGRHTKRPQTDSRGWTHSLRAIFKYPFIHPVSRHATFCTQSCGFLLEPVPTFMGQSP